MDRRARPPSRSACERAHVPPGLHLRPRTAAHISPGVCGVTAQHGSEGTFRSRRPPALPGPSGVGQGPLRNEGLWLPAPGKGPRPGLPDSQRHCADADPSMGAKVGPPPAQGQPRRRADTRRRWREDAQAGDRRPTVSEGQTAVGRARKGPERGRERPAAPGARPSSSGRDVLSVQPAGGPRRPREPGQGEASRGQEDSGPEGHS